MGSQELVYMKLLTFLNCANMSQGSQRWLHSSSITYKKETRLFYTSSAKIMTQAVIPVSRS